jgi:hypothetical protein
VKSEALELCSLATEGTQEFAAAIRRAKPMINPLLDLKLQLSIFNYQFSIKQSYGITEHSIDGEPPPEPELLLSGVR